MIAVSILANQNWEGLVSSTINLANQTWNSIINSASILANQNWEGMISVGILGALLLFANLLRRKIAFIRNGLIPTSVLAGFIGLLLQQIGLISIDIELMDAITYHGLAIGFIALGLRTARNKEKGTKAKGEGLYNSINSGMLIVSNYLMQGALGLIITIIAAYTFAPGFFKASGILLPMGYGQGPGQANNIGTMYETMGFSGGKTFGLAIASMGFICASIGGVIRFYYLKNKNKLPPEFYSGIESAKNEVFEDADEHPLSEPVERLSIQFALIGVVYLVSYGLIYGFLWLLSRFNGLTGLVKTLSPILWGFNFIIASSIALLMRGLLNKLRKMRIMTHQYPNHYLLNRISGLAFDAMIIAGISSISIADLEDKWLVFAILTIAGGVATFFYCLYMGKKVYPQYPVSGMLGMFGMMTGTASTGIMLLRQSDPMFVTPMSGNLVTGSSTAIVFGAPILVLVGLAPQSTLLTFVTLGACLLYWAILHFSLLYRVKKHAHKKAETQNKNPSCE